MQIVDLAAASADLREQAAQLLITGFHEPRGWSSPASAREEVARVLTDGFAFAAVRDAQLLGWIGGIPHAGYAGRVWELHPMVVGLNYRRRGIGRALVAAFESKARQRGALTATLGTDDDSGMTSLADVNLYDQLPGHIANARDLGRGHPFLFYQQLGYVITGVMPEANGPGRPDIYMSKSLAAP